MLNIRYPFLALFLISYLSLTGNVVLAAGEFRVVASIKPVHSILAGLMEGSEAPELLVSGDRSPFDYVLEPDQAIRLTASQMIVWIGPELEKFLVEPIAGLGPETHIVTLLDNTALKILPSRWSESGRDPYFWLDSRNGLILVDELTRALVAVDPARSHLYKRNRERLHKRMARLDRKLEYGYRSLKKGQGLTYYDTQQYFEQAYALKIGEALVESPASAVAAVDLVDTRIKLASGEYACLLVEAPLKMSSLGLLVDGMDVSIGSLDSFGLGFEAGADLYFEIMEYNTRAINNCLRRDQLEESPVAEPQGNSAPGEIGGRFMMVDHAGKLFTDKDMLGSYQLIFFGYLSCPDVCPISLVTGSRALEIIGDKSDRIQPYFITVDPERDTPELVGKYIGHFSDKIIGLTGTTTMLERVATHYNVKYEKVYEEGGDLNSYTMDHTSSFYFMGPNGRFITKFAYGITSEQLAEKLGEYIR